MNISFHFIVELVITHVALDKYIRSKDGSILMLLFAASTEVFLPPFLEVGKEGLVEVATRRFEGPSSIFLVLVSFAN